MSGYGTARGFRDGDEFERAEIDDYELERAADRELRELDSDELLDVGDRLVQPSLAEAIAQESRARAASWAASERLIS